MEKVTLDLSEVTFTRGAALGPGSGYLGIQVDELIAERIPHTMLVFLRGEEVYADNLTWNVCDILRLDDGTVAVLGDQGEFRIYAGRELVLERNIDTRLAGPLRGLMAKAEGEVWAVGTLLQVYAFRNGQWSVQSPVDAGTGKEQLARRAFEHAAPMNASYTLAFGWEGETWSHVAGRWTRIDSPTSIDLFAAASTGVADQLAICGQLGTVVLATPEECEAIESADVIEDLWSICRFQRRMFCASSHMVYELLPDQRLLVPLDASDLILPTGSGHLSVAADQVMWSVGPRELYEWDGVQWTALLEVE